MAHEWFPWYPALYRANTMHLTPEQDGIYRRLIDFYMETRQPLLDNDMAMARAAGITIELWQSNSEIIRAFFKPVNGKLTHTTCNGILKDQDGRSKIHSEKGKIGAKKRWEKDKENQKLNSRGHSPAIATPMPKHSTRQDRTRQDKTEYNNINILNPKKIGLEDLGLGHISEWLDKKRAAGEYVHHDERAILEGFKDYCRSNGKKYADYPAALRNAFQWEKYQPKGQKDGNYTIGHNTQPGRPVTSHSGAIGSRSVHQGSLAASNYRKQVIADAIERRAAARHDAEMAGSLDAK